MGRKRTRSGKYLHLLLACIIFLSFGGCALFRELGAKRAADGHLAAGQRLFDEGDFEGALREDRSAFALTPDAPPGDRALFHEGLIYAHPGYGKRDTRKSLNAMRTLVKTFPESPLATEAKAWIGLLLENERLKREAQDLSRTIKRSKQVDMEVDERKRGLSR